MSDFSREGASRRSGLDYSKLKKRESNGKKDSALDLRIEERRAMARKICSLSSLDPDRWGFSETDLSTPVISSDLLMVLTDGQSYIGVPPYSLLPTLNKVQGVVSRILAETGSLSADEIQRIATSHTVSVEAIKKLADSRCAGNAWYFLPKGENGFIEPSKG